MGGVSSLRARRESRAPTTQLPDLVSRRKCGMIGTYTTSRSTTDAHAHRRQAPVPPGRTAPRAGRLPPAGISRIAPGPAEEVGWGPLLARGRQAQREGDPARLPDRRVLRGARVRADRR